MKYMHQTHVHTWWCSWTLP